MLCVCVRACECLAESDARAQAAVKTLLEELGEDPSREGLVKTPARYVKAMRFFTQGYHQKLDTVLNKAIFTEDSDEMVMLRNIELFRCVCVQTGICALLHDFWEC